MGRAPRQMTAPVKKQDLGGRQMTDGEIAYIAMVVVVFAAFFIVIGIVSQTQDERRGQ